MLTLRSPRRVAVSDSGTTYFSIPTHGAAAALVSFSGGKVKTVLDAQTTIGGLGVLTRPQVIAASAADDILISAALDTGAAGTKPTIVGTLQGTKFTEIAREGTTPSETITNHRTVGNDDTGGARYGASLAGSDPGTTINALRIGNGSSTEEIVRELGIPPGGGPTVLALKESRINSPGDVAFVVELGTVEGGTTRLEEIRTIVRRADGTFVTVASTVDTNRVGTLTRLRIVGFNDNGDVLLIGSRARAGDRVLLLASSS